jgi:hypothetical protein
VAGKFRLRATSALSRTQLASFFPPLVSARMPSRRQERAIVERPDSGERLNASDLPAVSTEVYSAGCESRHSLRCGT